MRNGFRLTALTVAVAAALGAGGCASQTGAPVTGTSDNSAVHRFVQLQDLQNDLDQLSNQVEMQQHEISDLKQRQQELYNDLDRRLRAVERGGNAPAAAPGAAQQPQGGEGATQTSPESTGTQTASSPPAANAPAVADMNEQQAYDNAFNLLKQSRYGDAITAFQDFLQKYPKSSLAGSAQYWIAEAHYVNRDFKTALTGYQKVLSDYPNCDKVPDAMLKIGYSYYELGQRDDGRKMLDQLISQYPNTRDAVSAQNRLKKEGG